MKAPTLGSDPELMLFSQKSGKIVSSIPVIKKDKHDPVDLGKGYKMYSDNVLVECSFPPVRSADQFIAQMKDVFQAMQTQIGPEYGLLPQASHVFDKAELDTPECWQAGCDPNLDGYTEKPNPPAQFNGGLRSGSFHIHVGHDSLDTFDRKVAAIRVFDIIVGCASVIFDQDKTAKDRRSLYGKAGEFRPTPYGIEYRVLGNWALRSPEITQLVMDLVGHAMDRIMDGDGPATIKAAGKPARIQACINNNDMGMATYILGKVNIPDRLARRIGMNYGEPDLYRDWGIKI